MRITLVVVGGRNRSTKLISLPSALVIGVGIWLVLSLILGGAMYLVSSKNQRLQALTRDLRKDLAGKEQQLAARNSDLQKQQLALKKLNDRFKHIKAQFDDIHKLDVRIRRHLGLETREFTPSEGSHQGGSPAGSYSELIQSPSDPEPEPLNPTVYKNDMLARYADFLRDQSAEILDYLDSRSERLKRIPSILPVQEKGIWISSPFGWRKDPFTGRREFHNGLDVAGPHNARIIAPADGVVVKVSRDRYLGTLLRIDHGYGISTVYGHLSRCEVKKGDHVKRGQTIARMGNSGRSTGTHLHYSVIKNHRYMNPLDFIWDYEYRGGKLLAASTLHRGP